MTAALAGLDAALEMELSRDEEDESLFQSGDVDCKNNKVEQLEKQCKSLENELDSVKGARAQVRNF